MNVELCKKCDRNIVFTDNNEKSARACERKTFHCCSQIENFSFLFYFGLLNISTFIWDGNRWKRINRGLLQKVYFHGVSKWIDDLLERYDIDKVKYEDYYVCPYRAEHELYDWNKK